MADKHVMVDLETMGLRPNAAIVSIGAVHFDESSVIDTFHTAVSLQDCLDCGLTTDQSTVDWWMKQSVEARSSWQRDDAPKLLDALRDFSQWCLKGSSDRSVHPWGNGADFDMVLLKSAYSALEADPPWRYYNHRCFRTLRGVFPIAEPPRLGVHHSALDDALHQVKVLQETLKVHRIVLR